ncbi:MAG TPA: ribosome-associated translation inhibitor RaiA [Fimbriimonadales bacterium]|nr:ribosome-associated translation inhibitor RaiA [Fimbriimonadales bacterium]
MELIIRSAEGTVPERDREYASKRLSKLERFFEKATKAELVHHEQRGRHRVEVTVYADEFTVRGEEQDVSLRACIDKVSEILEARLRNLKERLVDAHRRGTAKIPPALIESGIEVSEAGKDQIVERKRFERKPMSPEEAILEMELLGDPFFVFENVETGDITVLYKRKDGTYGILEPEP